MIPDPGTPVALLMAMLTQLVGPQTAHIAGLVVGWATMVCTLCSLIVANVPPPAPGGIAAQIWRVISIGAVMLRFAKGSYQPGRTAVMVPRDLAGEVRTAVAETHDIPREETKP